MSTSFIHEDFMLQSEKAKRLYHDYAEDLPIIDYHCHLPPEQISSDKNFENLYEIWLAGDHYKWRAMRSNGVEEKFCTGEATDYEKFIAYAKTVPQCLRNPLYHWTHMELKRFFGIDKLLDESTAQGVWKEANEQLLSGDLSVHSILQANKVEVVCTTDDPADSLEHHDKIRESGLKTKVFPTFRPDKAMQLTDARAFNDWIHRLEDAAGTDCRTVEDLVVALEKRHEYFHSKGCRLSDHGLRFVPSEHCSYNEAMSIFYKARSGINVSRHESDKFGTWLMPYFGIWDAKRGWTKQLHVGAMRNNNTRLYKKLGADTGFDSIGDYPQAEALSHYLDSLDKTNELPRTIIYNLNPADNYVIGTLIGNFQDGSIAGKIQFGSGWWFLDQKEGMEWQINALSNLGLLSRFVGMITDSRSFLSYVRHDYFRRILCNMLGGDMERGEIPDDLEMVGALVKKVCYGNARDYFGFEA